MAACRKNDGEELVIARVQQKPGRLFLIIRPDFKARQK
jgi:hypothetical protein